MKLRCTQSDLNTHLSLVSRAVPSRPTHPVLANIKVEADTETQRVQLTGFDLSLGIRSSFSAEVQEGGTLTLPAKLLSDIVSRLPSGELQLDDRASDAVVSGDAAIATLTAASGSYKVRGMGAEEYPELPMIDSGQTMQISAEVFSEGLHGSLFATSSDETKLVLTGVHLKLHQDGLEFAATDSHRLAVVETSNAESEESETGETPSDVEEFEVTLPAKALREVERILGMRQGSQSITLRFDRGQVVFECGEQRLTSRTLEGQYPNYRLLIPNQFERQVTIDRKQLIGAMERISVLADQKNNIVKFTIDSDNNELALSVEAADVGSGREILPVELTGESIEIAFNVKYFLEGLKAINSQAISMQLNSPTSPAILTPLGGVKMTYLLMPVQLRS